MLIQYNKEKWERQNWKRPIRRSKGYKKKWDCQTLKSPSRGSQDCDMDYWVCQAQPFPFASERCFGNLCGQKFISTTKHVFGASCEVGYISIATLECQLNLCCDMRNRPASAADCVAACVLLKHADCVATFVSLTQALYVDAKASCLCQCRCVSHFYGLHYN